MKGKTTLVLAIVFAGLLLYVLKFQRGEPRKERQIFRFSKERVAKVELQYTDDEDTVVLEKQGETWQILKPLKAKGNTEDVEKVVGDFAGLESATTFSDDEAARLTNDMTGLDEPEFVAQAWDRRGKRLAKLAVGNKAAVGSDVYARVNDDYYVTLGSYTADGLKKKATDLRDKSIVDIAEDGDVESVQVAHAGQSIRVQRIDEEHWRITKPIEADGDEWSCKDLFTKLKDLKAEEFVERDKSKTPADYGLDKPQLVATVTLKDGPKQVVKLGAKVAEDAERIYAAAEGRDEIFEVKDTILDDLKKEVGDLRDRDLLDVQKDDVDRLEVVHEGWAFAARLKDDDWELEHPPGGKCDATKIDDILWEAVYLRADEFVAEKPKSLAKYGLDDPRAKVTLTAGRQSHTILLGEAKNDRMYAKLADKRNVVLVGDELLRKLPRKVAEIVEPEPEEIEEELGGDAEE
ncbi:MAG: DUF4340 domain-containing protein [Armatimonadota bacterium]|jgi:hypothetical protein